MKNNYTITLIPIPELGLKKRTMTISADLINLADCVLPGEPNPHNIQLVIIGLEDEPIGAVFAPDGQTALQMFSDNSPQYDASMMVDCWCHPADLQHRRRDCKLLIDLAEARGEGKETLADNK
jgi:hypothetical protein